MGRGSGLATGNRLELRTLKGFEAAGWRCERVRRPGQLKGGDVFNVIDLMACKDGRVVFVQVTTKGQRAAKIRKIAEQELGIEILLVLWQKHKARWVSSSELVLSELTEIKRLIRG